MKIKPLTILSVVFLSLILVLMILRLFFMENFVVRAGSMRDTLKHGDFILSWRLVSLKEKNNHPLLFYISLKRKDIVVLQVPGERDMLIKRIIGLPGETIDLRESSITINGTTFTEDYVSQDVHYTDKTYHIPEGKLLVLGDVRLTSRDSRDFGLLSMDDIKGKVFLIYFPFQRMKWFF